MEADWWWLLLALPASFALGWLGARVDLRQWRSEQGAAPKAYFRGLNLLLNEQQDKAIDAFIEAVRHDPDTTELHFALGNLFRRRGEYDRAIRVHEHLLGRADLPRADREKAQHALAMDFFKAGLFDRAEAAFQSLLSTSFAEEARLALLTLYERARDWPHAIEVARQLDASHTASFAHRVAHYWCELAIQADARGDTQAADAALAQARAQAPDAARPLVLEGQRQARQGNHAGALHAWSTLATVAPPAVALVASAWSASAQALGQPAAALGQLQALYDAHPCGEVLGAMRSLEPEAAQRRAWLVAHLGHQPSLSAALALLDEARRGEGTRGHLDAGEIDALHAALALAARPQLRYRCAACGFEAQQHFWQCPGCQTWDSFPPRRIEAL